MNEQLMDKINEAYDSLELTTTEYREKALRFTNLENQIKNKRAGLLLGGQITGKNAEIREAETLTILNDDYEKLFEAEIDRDVAYFRRELAQIRVERYRLTVRVLELSEDVNKPEEK